MFYKIHDEFLKSLKYPIILNVFHSKKCRKSKKKMEFETETIYIHYSTL